MQHQVIRGVFRGAGAGCGLPLAAMLVLLGAWLLFKVVQPLVLQDDPNAKNPLDSERAEYETYEDLFKPAEVSSYPGLVEKPGAYLAGLLCSLVLLWAGVSLAAFVYRNCLLRSYPDHKRRLQFGLLEVLAFFAAIAFLLGLLQWVR